MARPILLAVDDDVNVLEAVVQDLRREYGATYRVMRAASGQAGLDTLEQLRTRQEAVALIVSDQRMPGMTGVEFLERARSVYTDARRVLLTAYADSEFQLGQVRDVLTSKLVKRNVDVRFLDIGKIEKIGGDKVKQVIKIKNGIETEDAKKIVRVIKDSKLKVQASIQGDAVRVTGAKRDDLQGAMAMLRKEIKDLPLEFNNFRD